MAPSAALIFDDAGAVPMPRGYRKLVLRLLNVSEARCDVPK
jgi:hypothetical protein